MATQTPPKRKAMELPLDCARLVKKILSDDFYWGGKTRPNWRSATPTAKLIRELFILMDAFVVSNRHNEERIWILLRSPFFPERHYLRWTLMKNNWSMREFKQNSWRDAICQKYSNIPSTKAAICLKAFVLNEKALRDGRSKRKAARRAFGSA